MTDDVASRQRAEIAQVEVSGTGPVVVFVGNGFTGVLSWVPHANRLAATRTVALAQPLGVQLAVEDRALPRGYGIRMESEALLAALDARGWTQPVDIVGWSYGGVIALDLGLEHPDRVRSLTLVEPSAFWVLSEQERKDPEVRRMEATERAWANGLTEEDLVAFLKEIGALAEGESPSAHPRWPTWWRHRQALAANIAEVDHRDDMARLAAFPRPVLLVVGEGTAAPFRMQVDSLSRALPRRRVIELPGGHVAPVVSIDRFLEETLAFQKSAGAD